MILQWLITLLNGYNRELLIVIERLYHPTEQYFVGITEIRNNHNLTTADLLGLTQDNKDGILAVQFLSSQLIAGTSHLMSAAQNALNAYHGEYMISRSLNVEIILYASAQRQISVAFEKFGLADNLERVALVIIGTDPQLVETNLNSIIERVGTPLSTPFAPSDERILHILEYFDIGSPELSALTSKKDIQSRYQALTRCVCSRVSLVAVDS